MIIDRECELDKWSVCPTTMLADAQNYYTKKQVDDIVIEAGAVTPSIVSGMIEDYAYSKEEVNDLLDEKAYVSAVTEAIDEIASGKVNVSTFEEYTASTETALSNKQDALTAGDGIDITNNVISVTSTSIDSGAVQTMIDQSISGKADTSGLTAYTSTVTTSELSGTVTAHTSNTDIHVTSEDKTAWNAKQDALTAGDGIDITSNVISVTSTSIDSGTVQTMIDQSVSGKADTSALTAHTADTTIHVTAEDKVAWNTVTDKADSTAVTAEISAAVSGKMDTSGMTAYTSTATTSELSGVVTSHTANTNIHVTAEDKTTWNTVTSKADSTAVTAEISAAVSGKANSADVYTTAQTSSSTEVSTALSGKQDTLVSGTNIKTINNESILGSGNITVQGGNDVVELTQEEYDELDPPAEDTFYIITDAVPIDMSNYYTSAQTESAITAAVSGKADTSGLTAYTSTATTSELSGVVTSHTANTEVHVTTGDKATWNTVTDKADSTAVTAEISAAVSGKADTSGLTAYTSTATTNELSGTVTAHTANTDVHVTAEDKSAWNAKSDFSGSYNDLTNKLSAGTNITIVDNVISAEGGGGKAVSGGTNISITTGETADTINCTLPINATSNVFNTISVGQDSGGGTYNTLIGPNIRCDTSNGHNVFLVAQKSNNSGNGAYVNGTYNVIIGAIKDGYLNFGIQSFSTSRSVVIGGGGISTDKDNSVAIGYLANVSGTTKTNINNQLTIDTSNQVYIYNKDNTEMICLQDQLGGDGSSYSAGTGIDITNDVISVTGMTAESAFTAHTADTTIHVTTAQTAAWDAKSNFSGSYNDLTDKPTIPTVPTSNTAFTNDAGYITSADITGKADTSAVTQEISAAVSGKADTSGLTAYTSTATTNELSGTVTAHTADTTIHVTTGDKATWNTVTDKADSTAVTAEISAAVSGKADTSGLTAYTSTATTNELSGTVTAHTADTTIHVTSSDKTTWNAKQDALTAGTGIDITSNVISVTGGSGGVTSAQVQTMIDESISGLSGQVQVDEEVTARALVDLNDRLDTDEEVTSRALVDLDSRFGGLKLVKLTQTEYTNLQNKDANTLYVII